MELDGRFNISNCFLISIAFTYYYPLDADGIGDIAIRMLFYNYLYRLHLLARGCS